MPGPDQLKLVPDAVAADRTTAVVVQLSVPPVALAPGATIFAFTDAVAVLEHPFSMLVTVTVNVPDEETVGFAVLAPETMPTPAQLKLGPEVPPAAERITDVALQVSVPPVALAPGAVVFVLTDALAVLVQPPAEVVAVTVYVPSELTTGLAVVPPETMPGPAQLKLTPPVAEFAERTTEVAVQVSVPPVELAPGGVHDC